MKIRNSTKIQVKKKKIKNFVSPQGETVFKGQKPTLSQGYESIPRIDLISHLREGNLHILLLISNM